MNQRFELTYQTTRLLAVLLFFVCLVSLVSAQPRSVSAIPLPSNTLVASTNVPGAAYPRVDDQGKVYFHVSAPEATSVSVSLGNMALTKDKDGFWTGITPPQDPGFHYYTLKINGVDVCDPASETFYGMSRMASGIEIPEKGVDFYKIKEVPHGVIHSNYYYSTVTKSWRRLFVYTPAGYDTETSLKYPVVYLQHGGGEDERGWVEQGKTAIIMDNLIAGQQAIPMIVVIAYGNVSTGNGGYSSAGMAAFKEEMTQNIVPFMDKNYRTLPDAAHRALCGLSMGGGQSFYVGLESLHLFGSVGVFSSGIFGGIANPSGASGFDAEKEMPGLLSQATDFNKKLHLFYVSVGEQDPRYEFTKAAVKSFKDKGLNVEFASFPGQHEWQVWRKSLHDFASRVFKK